MDSLPVLSLFFIKNCLCFLGRTFGVVVDDLDFNETGLCITFTESAESIIEARDLSSQGVAVESNGLALGDT